MNYTHTAFVRAAALLMVLMLAAYGCTEKNATDPFQPYTAEGIASDEHGNVWPGVQVEMLRGSTTIWQDSADDEGVFAVPIETLSDDLSLRFHSQGRLLHRIPLADYAKMELRDGRRRLRFAPDDSCCGSLLVRVVTESGATVPKATVKIRRGKAVQVVAKSDSAGVARFSFLCEGEAELVVIADHLRAVEMPIRLGNCDSTAVTEGVMVAKDKQEDSCCKGTVVFTVLGPEQNALKGASVSLYKDGKKVALLTTGEQGKADAKLCEGRYVAVIAREGMKPVETAVEIGCETTTEKTVQLTKAEEECCKGTVVFTVLGPEQNALKGASVSLYKDGKKVALLTTGEQGKADAKLCEGRYVAVIAREGMAAVEVEIDVECEGTTLETVQLAKKEQERCCTASLLVKAMSKATNKRVANASVVVTSEGAVVSEGTTDAEGTLKVGKLCAPATYAITVSHPELGSVTYEITFSKCTDLQETFWLAQ